MLQTTILKDNIISRSNGVFYLRQFFMFQIVAWHFLSHEPKMVGIQRDSACQNHDSTAHLSGSYDKMSSEPDENNLFFILHSFIFHFISSPPEGTCLTCHLSISDMVLTSFFSSNFKEYNS